MAKLRQEVEQEDGWSQEIAPDMNLYKMGCCDCGLVHDITYWVVKVTKVNDDGTWECEDADDSYRVIFRARRNKRSTGQVRRHKKETQPAPVQNEFAKTKSWQGLSNDMVLAIGEKCQEENRGILNWIDFYNAIESMLKDKNYE